MFFFFYINFSIIFFYNIWIWHVTLLLSKTAVTADNSEQTQNFPKGNYFEFLHPFQWYVVSTLLLSISISLVVLIYETQNFPKAPLRDRDRFSEHSVMKLTQSLPWTHIKSPMPRIKEHTERHFSGGKRTSQQEDSLRVVVAPSPPRLCRHRFSRAWAANRCA